MTVRLIFLTVIIKNPPTPPSRLKCSPKAQDPIQLNCIGPQPVGNTAARFFIIIYR